MDLTEFDLKKIKVEMPELPEAKRQRFKKEFYLKDNQAEILIDDKKFADYFEKAATKLILSIKRENSVQILYNYLASDLKGLMKEMNFTIEEIKIAPENFTELIVLIVKGELSSRLAKEILKEMAINGQAPVQIMKEKGLTQIFDEEALRKTAIEVITENPKAVEDYKKGKESAMQFLIGRAMGRLKGRGNPDILKKLLRDCLSK